MTTGLAPSILVSAPARFPSIDGDFVAYESDLSGNFDVYLYRLTDGEAFQVTSDLSDQFLNNIYGDNIGYVDLRNGNFDIFVSHFEIVPPSPCAAQGGDSDFDGVCEAVDNCPLIWNPNQEDACGLTPPEISGDIDSDGDVDRDDVMVVFSARGSQASGPDDPRDLDGDGSITVGDARALVLKCSHPKCAVQ